MKLKYLVSHDFRHTAFNQLWRLVSGPLLLLFIPFYLSAETQGYWYTFVSLAALAVFADMGFSAILMLFSSHEFANLKFGPNCTLVGDEHHIRRLAALWRFSLKWTGVMACVVFPIVLVVGLFLLKGKQSTVAWEWPWVIYGMASVLIFVNSMALSFIEGFDSVGDIQKIRLKISMVNVGVTLLLLIWGANLYSLALSLMVASAAGSALIFGKYRRLFSQLYHLVIDVEYRWFNDIMPLMWKYAISWISGYFILSMFPPVAFHYYSPVEAGKVGLSIAVCSAVFAIANVWMIVITPKINIFVAQKDYSALNGLFFRHLILAMLTYVAGISGLFWVLHYMSDYFPIATRLVSDLSLACLALGWFLQLIVNALAIYMRAHKEEPLMLASFLNGVWVACGTVMLAIFFPVDYFFFGFLSAFIWVLPWVYLMFAKYKQRGV